MKFLNFILLFILVQLAISNILNEPMIRRLNVRRNHNQWILNPVCLLSKQPCSFQYTSIPSYWIVQRQTMKVPLKNINYRQQQIIRVRVRDWRQRQVQQQFKLSITKEKIILIAKNVITQDSDLKNAVIKRSQPSESQKKGNLVLKDYNQLSWMERNGIKSFLPSVSYFKNIIGYGDIQQISRVIQFIISDSTQCTQKTQYLKEISQQLDLNLRQNKNQLQNQKRIKKKTQLEIKRLQFQYQQLQKKIKEDSVYSQESLIEMEKKLISQRSSIFARHYSTKIIANKYLQKLNQYKGDDKLRDDQRNRIQMQIDKDQRQVEDIQNEIKKLMKRKEQVQKKINQNQHKIEGSLEYSTKQNNKIKNLEKKFNQYLYMSSQYENRYKKIDEQLKNVRQRLQTLSFQSNQHKQKLQYIQQQLSKIKPNNFNLEKLQSLIQVQERNKPKLQKIIQQCQEYIRQKENQRQKELARNKYSEFKIDDLIQAQIPPKSKFYHMYPILQKINIFSTNWILQYGIPSTYFFSCKYSHRETFGYGIITAINAGSLRVRDQNGKIYALYIGTCSMIEGINKNYVPKIGDVIQWDGGVVATGIINIYNARVFSNYK